MRRTEYPLRVRHATHSLHAAALMLCSLALVAEVNGDTPGQAPEDFAHMSFEQLADISITSVSKKAESLNTAAASVYVITSDDIRRSGATSLPEALRLAPNLFVAQVNANGYSISARGFNNVNSNKLLVLIDGRCVYSPLASTVFWDVQNVVMTDVDRIEVISGSGGVLWGTNAVNGVINVVTKSAKQTKDGLLVLEDGNRDSTAAMHYGAAVGENAALRVYGKTFDVRRTETAADVSKPDAWHQTMGGLRFDWSHSVDALTVEANAYRGIEGQPLPGTIAISGVNLPLGAITVSGANVLSRWEHHLGDGSNISLQAYYDRTERIVPPTFADHFQVYDVELVHALAPIGRHALTWGTELRYGSDEDVGGQYFAFVPANVNQHWLSIYVQDDIRLTNSLRLVAGFREVSNPYTGGSRLPSLRLAWAPATSSQLWLARSKTVRSPSRLDADARVPGEPPYILRGGLDVDPEAATMTELGYRTEIARKLTLSATLYHAYYENLRTQELAPDRTYVFYSDAMVGYTNGLEMWGTLQASSTWRISAGLTTQRERLELEPRSTDTISLARAGHDPANTWSIRSAWDLPDNIELDLAARHVSTLTDAHVPGYVLGDIHLGWRPTRNIETSLTVQNMFNKEHGEFSDRATRTDIGRNAFLKLVVSF